VDDGSKDRSGEICDKYAKMDKRVKVFHQSNKGRCIARNVGLENALGEWIVFLDSDDWIEPDFVKDLLHVHELTGSNIVSCKTQIWVGDIIDKQNIDTGKISTFNLENIIKGLLTQEIIRFELWNKLIKRELLDGIEFLPGQLSEEVHIDRLIFLKTNSLSHIDKTLHNYLTQRPGNTVSKFNPSRMAIFSEFDELVADLISRGREDLAEVVQCIAMQFVILIYMEALEHKQSNEVKTQLKEYEKKYYETANKSKYYSSHIGLKIFKFSPRTYYSLDLCQYFGQ
jgi:glycosyltransferase involved in cell wall biosynthesis